jgi:hypothetical protein
MALAQLLEPIVFEGDAERRFKEDDSENGGENVRGLAIQPMHKRNVIAAPPLQQGTGQGQRCQREHKQVEDLVHRSFSQSCRSKIFG